MGHYTRTSATGKGTQRTRLNTIIKFHQDLITNQNLTFSYLDNSNQPHACHGVLGKCGGKAIIFYVLVACRVLFIIYKPSVCAFIYLDNSYSPHAWHGVFGNCGGRAIIFTFLYLFFLSCFLIACRVLFIIYKPSGCAREA